MARHQAPAGLIEIPGFYAYPSLLPDTYVTLCCVGCSAAAGPVVEGKQTAARVAQARRWTVESDEIGMCGVCPECVPKRGAS